VVSYEICSGKINAQTAPSPFHPAAISVAPRTLRINKSAKKKVQEDNMKAFGFSYRTVKMK